MTKKLASLIITMMLVMALVLPACKGAAPEVQQWRFSTPFPAGDTEEIAMEDFADAVRADTDGVVDITVYPGDSLGYKKADAIDAVEAGILDIAHVALNVLEGAHPVLGIPHLSFFYATDEEILPSIPIIRPYVDEVAAKRNAILIGYWSKDLGHLFCKRAAPTVESLEGLKLRGVRAIQREYFPLVGITPVSLAKAETYSAIATGVVDGLFYTMDSAYDMKVHELCKKVSTWAEGTITYGILVNRDVFDALPKDMQDAILKRANELNDELWQIGYHSHVEMMDKLKAEGCEFIEVSEAEKAKMREILYPVWGEVVGKGGPEAIEAMNAVLKAMGRPAYK